MRVESAILCDAATVRDGLLHILGGGITRLRVNELPTSLPLTFAFRAVLETRELRPRYKLVLRLLTQEGKPEAAIEATFEVDAEEAASAAAEEAGVAAPIPLGAFVVSRPGKYLIEANFNNYTFATIPLRVTVAEPNEV